MLPKYNFGSSLLDDARSRIWIFDQNGMPHCSLEVGSETAVLVPPERLLRGVDSYDGHRQLVEQRAETALEGHGGRTIGRGGDRHPLLIVPFTGNIDGIR